MIAGRVQPQPRLSPGWNGSGPAGVLGQLRDGAPEKFERLNDEVGRWLPEFERILFETPESKARAFKLRAREGKHEIRAADLSHGTLLALALLALAYMPDKPAILCIEEPDRGIHPRLLREVRDAIHRLSYPHGSGTKQEPVQVIAPTHSPYMPDLFRDHPEGIVLAHEAGSDVRFERLSDRPDLEKILEDVHLSDAWYGGILGGIPAPG